MKVFGKIVFVILILASGFICQAQEKVKTNDSAPIYADVLIKNKDGKYFAEFKFYTIYREKNEGDEFAEVFIKKVAVTNPKINNAALKMIPKKNGIAYEGKISGALKKYLVSFQQLSVHFAGEVTINPKKNKEIKQVKFYLK
ncbi:MAG: hypothetical protein K1X72_15270 [Pyrinomonadaceae bacterium]|nr:hypothetical protein [Pyrinomonadaceae bacterium]